MRIAIVDDLDADRLVSGMEESVSQSGTSSGCSYR